MARPDKAATVAELTERFKGSTAVVLTEYRGLTVSQITQLRSNLQDVATYTVTKNTLTKIAAREAGVSAFEDQLVGPSAVAFVTGDPVEAAKGLRDFARTNPALVIKGGYLDGNVLSADEVRKLADLESREVLLAKLAGAMKASLTKAAVLFNAPLSKAVRTVDALRLKLEEGAPAEAPAEASDAASDEAAETTEPATADA
jgi:large subunit ribosomal protein L10